MASLSGTILNARTNQPLPGITVTIDGRITNTDSNGNYFFGGLIPGDYLLKAVHRNFQNSQQIVNVTQDINITVSLTPL